MITKTEVTKFHGRAVQVDFTANGLPTSLTGRVLQVSDTAIVIQARSNTRIIELVAVTAVVEKRRPRPLVRRNIRILGAADSMRQHLVDRHGFSVTLATSIDEETAREYHTGFDHADLGHIHSHALSPTEAMSQLEATG